MNKKLKEDTGITMAAGNGAIAGIGVGKDGEPAVNTKNRKKIIPFKLFRRKQQNGSHSNNS